MLIVDCVLYFLLAVYLDNVIQGEYGRARPIWFFLMPSYWLNRGTYYKEKTYMKNPIDIEQDLEMRNDSDIEPITDEFKDKVALKIRNLLKIFKNEQKEAYNAVDNLNLTIYSGQITAILGHNGKL
jgi:ABC-type transport system involved in cytochrome bd biosynthesis fused ATPase/permease subunit